jgi:ubiquinone/menaquinone biosynthesis C-methylase UbiE
MTTHKEQNAAIRDQFGKQAESYARLVQSGRNVTLEKLTAALKPAASDHLLDVGCGTGRISLSLAPFVGHVTGIDLTPQMLNQAKALQAQLGITNVSWQQGDILPLPFADGSFSIVLTQATFHHFADPAAVLSEMIRVAAPAGRIAVIDMTFDPAKAEAFDRWEKLRDPSHLHVLSPEKLKDLGRAAGLKELFSWSYPTAMPIEAVLATSFPAPGDMEQVRTLVREDAASGEDRLGIGLHEEAGQIIATYPMTMQVWGR